MTQIILTEKIVLDAGYRQAYTPARDDVARSPRLDGYRRGQRVKAQTRVSQMRITEGELIRQMQTTGVGRPSTYAVTLESLRRHGYIQEQGGSLRITPRGWEVLEFLAAHYPLLLDPTFSVGLEAQLDALAHGKTTYQALLKGLLEKLQQEK